MRTTKTSPRIREGQRRTAAVDHRHQPDRQCRTGSWHPPGLQATTLLFLHSPPSPHLVLCPPQACFPLHLIFSCFLRACPPPGSRAEISKHPCCARWEQGASVILLFFCATTRPTTPSIFRIRIRTASHHKTPFMKLRARQKL